MAIRNNYRVWTWGTYLILNVQLIILELTYTILTDLMQYQLRRPRNINASPNYLSVTLPSVTLNTTVKGIYTATFSLSMSGEIFSEFDDTVSNGQFMEYILLNYRRNNWQSPAFDIVVQNTDPS